MTTLILPPGAENGPISDGVTAFVPYREDHTNPLSRWMVDVPPDVAGRLIGVGGFIVAGKVSERMKASLVRMFHPDNGVNDDYEVEDGFHLVPNGPEVDAMRSHGFKMEGEDGKPVEAPEMVPAEYHQSALDHIRSLEEQVREHERSATMARRQLEGKDGEIAALTEKLAEKAEKPKPAA